MATNDLALQRQIRKYILDNILFSDEESALPNDASLLDLGIIDSTGVLELAHFLTTQFDIEVSDDELLPENFDSVDNLVRFVVKRLEGT